MKKLMIKALCAILLVAFAMSAIACGSDVYEELGDQGYTIKIRFEAGDGAVVNETQNVTIVETYRADETVTVGGKTGIRLLAPDDPLRGEHMFKIAKNTEDAICFSTGWYTNRTEVAEGQYVYSGLWDFENDLLDPGTLENGELTLYAAWIPAFTYEFYAQGEDGSFELIGSKRKIDLKLPEWNERKEEWKLNDLPKVEGKEFVAAYLDEAMTQTVTGTIDGRSSFVDYEQGIATQSVIKVYIKWTDSLA